MSPAMSEEAFAGLLDVLLRACSRRVVVCYLVRLVVRLGRVVGDVIYQFQTVVAAQIEVAEFDASAEVAHGV